MLFTNEENDLLTQTGRDTPMGRLMRRYWFPAFLSERLPETPSDPFEISLLGESLVAFRGGDGMVGLMGSKCPHRGASLVLARVEDDCALRCIYHGWKVRGDGQVLETPPEPPNSRFAQSVRHIAYPTREAAGMVWTYMGPPDDEPPFPMWPFNALPESHVWANHYFQPSNYLQGLEGDMDAAHGGYLHYSKAEWERQAARAGGFGKFLFDPTPTTAVERSSWGVQTVFRYALENETDAAFWVHPMISPFFTMFAQGTERDTGGLFHAWVPSTDGSHYVYSVIWDSEKPITEEDKLRIDTTQGFTQVDKENGYRSVAWTDDGYVQDRESMKTGDSFSGFEGVHLQDLAVQNSMGPIVDRSKENLCTEDFLVIQVRRFLLETLEKMDNGGELPGLQPGMDYTAIEYRRVLAPADTPLRDVLTNKEWKSEERKERGTDDYSLTAWGALKDS